MKKRSNIENEITFADGEPAKVAVSELFRIVDVFASHYGLSGRTLTEFTKMVNEEDPFIINGLLMAIQDRVNIANGKSKNVSSIREEEVGFTNRTHSTSNVKATFGYEKGQMIEFLYNFGAPKDKIKEALQKIESGKMLLPQYDHSWITPAELAKSDFPFERVSKEMEENRKRSINIEVSLGTLQGRSKDG